MCIKTHGSEVRGQVTTKRTPELKRACYYRELFTRRDDFAILVLIMQSFPLEMYCTAGAGIVNVWLSCRNRENKTKFTLLR